MSRVLRSNAADENVNERLATTLGNKLSAKTSLGKARNALGDISNRNAVSAAIGDGKNGSKKPSRIPVSRVHVIPAITQQPIHIPTSAAVPAVSTSHNNDDVVSMETDSDDDLKSVEEKRVSHDHSTNALSYATSALSLSKPSWPCDALLKNNAQYVSVYVHEIMLFWRQDEINKAASHTYMNMQNDITPRMREILIDWLNEVHAKFHLSLETLYLTVYILDKFLEKAVIPRTRLQLVGCTSMLLAAKYEETYAPEINEFVSISDHSFSRSAMLDMESKMLNTLKFNITAPSSWRFLQRYQQTLGTYLNECNDEDHTVRVLSEFFLEMTLQDYSFIRYLPSVLAASSLLLACHSHDERVGMQHWREVSRLIEHTERGIQGCVEDIILLVNNNISSKYRAVRKKYNSINYQGVGTVVVSSPW